MGKKIDSHVQNSRTIIKNFKKSEEDGNTCALDLTTWKIDEKRGPSKIGIIYGYFNKETELFLSSKYETPIGNAVKRIKEFESNNTIELLTASEILDIKRYLAMLMVREPSLIEKTVAKTIIAKELGIKPTPSEFVKLLEQTTLVDTFFDNHYPVIVFNKTNTSFISSIKGFYVWKSIFNDLNWWFPVTPTLAIHFVDKGVFEQLYKHNNGAEIVEDIVVIEHNNKMIESAMNDGNKYVFSNKSEELERLIKKYSPSPSLNS